MKKIVLVLVIFSLLAYSVSASVLDCATSTCIGYIGDTCLGYVGPIATPGVSCTSDNNACTTDVCGANSFECVHTSINCDDGNPSTTDGCNPETGVCYHATSVNNGDPCNDGNACTIGDVWFVIPPPGAMQMCIPGTVLTCDDGSILTTDSCNPSTGCVNTMPAPTACDDGNACTTGDLSYPLIGCMGGAVLVCDDGDVDTTDSCDSATGCVFTPICVPSTEICGDGVDNDCNDIVDDLDLDGDGFLDPACGGTDCNDENAGISPGDTEVPGNDWDEDCSGSINCYEDLDDDGFGSNFIDYNTYVALGGIGVSSCSVSTSDQADDTNTDCDDDITSINPGMTETICNTINDDCNEGTLDNPDVDGDGFFFCTDDCDDDDEFINPVADEIVANGVDDDCTGQELCYKDGDNDGYRPDGSSTVTSNDLDCTDSGEATAADPTGDCDDTRTSVYSGATEICDTLDNDCDTQVDEGCSASYCINEGFEGSFPPVGWSVFKPAGFSGTLFTQSASHYEGNYSAYAPGAINQNAFLTLPGTTIANGTKLKFWARITNNAGIYAYLAVHYSNNPLSSTNTGNMLTTYSDNIAYPVLLSTAWTEYEIDLSAYAGQNIYLGLYHSGGKDIYIDSVTVEECTIVGAVEECNGIDDDLDGMTDEDLTGPLCSLQSGVCMGSRMSCEGVNGWQDCNVGAYSAFSTDYELAELTCDSLDNDCDGSVDEGGVCVAPPICGNGIVETGEGCDDGDVDNADGCSSVCSIEPGWNCVGSPSICIIECVPLPELYDLVDNDCDGLIDELEPNPLEYYTKTELSSTWPIYGASLIGFSGTWVDSTVTDALEWLYLKTVDLQTQIDNIELIPGPQGPVGPQGPQGVSGLPGADGPQGEPGDQGLPGQDGDNGFNCWDLNMNYMDDSEEDINGDKLFNVLDCQGAKGDKGDTGTQGIPGVDGTDGLAGPQGIPGEKGDTGDVGPAGADGLNGEDGKAGLNGIHCWDLNLNGLPDIDEDITDDGFVDVFDCQGIKGEAGPKGDKGDTGDVGPAGADGAVGPQGIQGISGIDGATGPMGPQGNQGNQGFSVVSEITAENAGTNCVNGGDKISFYRDTNNDGIYQGATDVPLLSIAYSCIGETGAQGVPGEKGDTGETGPQGEIGPKGEQGDVGPAGEQGLPGEKGDTGDVGPAGADGAVGPQGETGPMGPQGIPGVDGLNGTDGAVGPQGEIGPIGPQGEQGIPGEKGDTGPAGTEDFTMNYYSCDNYNSGSTKTCKMGKHMFCYLTGQKNKEVSNNNAYHLCDINGNLNGHWEVKAVRAWCEVRCINS